MKPIAPGIVQIALLASSLIKSVRKTDAFVAKQQLSTSLSMCLQWHQYNNNQRQKNTVFKMNTVEMDTADLIERESFKENKNTTRFASPLLEFGYLPAVNEFEEGITSTKPLLLYIPGFDGTFLSAFFQYPELHTEFEVRCLVSTMEDRSSFDDLKNVVLDFLVKEATSIDSVVNGTKSTPSTYQSTNDAQQKDEPEIKTTMPDILSGLSNQQKQAMSLSAYQRTSQPTSELRPVYLVGESFGGLLASEVALAALDSIVSTSKPTINLQGLVLVNAATCYHRSRLAAEGPSVARLPKLLYVFGILKLLPMFTDKISLAQLLVIFKGEALPSLIDNPTREAYMGRFALSLLNLLQFIPQDTFQWRLEQWLDVGCQRMETTLAQLADRARETGLKTLIVAGENDLTLPSIAEAERLVQLLPNSHVHIVPAVGHANTCGTCLDLAAEMRKHFSELQMNKRRTAMKDIASKGQGIYYGMEPRYDGKRIGLSPLSYWAKEYHRKVYNLPS